MINIKKFEFNKSYKEVEIAGEVYKIEFNDEKLMEYQEEFLSYYRKAKDINELDGEELEKEDLVGAFEDAREITKEVLDVVLGEGTFDVLYEKSGHSTLGMVDVVDFISDIVGEGMEDIRDRRKQDYIPKTT